MARCAKDRPISFTIRILRTGSLAIAFACAGGAPDFAQSISQTLGGLPSDPVSDEVVRALLQRSAGGPTSAAPLQPNVQIQNPPIYSPQYPYVPGITANPLERFSNIPDTELSPLEKLMSVRVGQRVT